MIRLGKAGATAAAIVILLGGGAEAGSLQLRYNAAEIDAAISHYEREVILRDWAPEKFDRVHPLAGRMLSDESVYEKLLREWEEHPARFERNHRCLWHVLVGDMLYHEEHPFVPLVVHPGDVPAYSENSNPQGGGNPGNHDNGGSGGGIHSASVPEPSSMALLISGLIAVLLAAACRRAYARIRVLRQAGT